ncbi:MAG: hypothetical protein ACK5LT_05295 [Lachnospirales bacterium]
MRKIKGAFLFAFVSLSIVNMVKASNLTIEEKAAYELYLKDIEHENLLKEEALKKSKVYGGELSTEKDEMDIAYENMLIRENYIVDLVFRLLKQETSFEEWEYNLDYLINNYEYISKQEDVNMKYVNIYIEDYENLRYTKDWPDEKKVILK